VRAERQQQQQDAKAGVAHVSPPSTLACSRSAYSVANGPGGAFYESTHADMVGPGG
jgi:hypothetical protein